MKKEKKKKKKRLIRNGEKRYGGVERGRLYVYRYTVTDRMTAIIARREVRDV